MQAWESRVADLEEASIARDTSPRLAARHALVDDTAQGVHVHPVLQHHHHQVHTIMYVC